MKHDKTKCIVCAADAVGKFGPNADACEPEEREAKSVPCCEECGMSGKVQKWWDAANAEIMAWPKAIPTGDWPVNIADALLMVRADVRSDARIEDGVCPNGCARMIEDGPGDQHCPLCGFGYSHRTINASQI